MLSYVLMAVLTLANDCNSAKNSLEEFSFNPSEILRVMRLHGSLLPRQLLRCSSGHNKAPLLMSKREHCCPMQVQPLSNQQPCRAFASPTLSIAQRNDSPSMRDRLPECDTVIFFGQQLPLFRLQERGLMVTTGSSAGVGAVVATRAVGINPAGFRKVEEKFSNEFSQSCSHLRESIPPSKRKKACCTSSEERA